MRFTLRALVVLGLALLGLACPQNDEDSLMLHIYAQYHSEIERATTGTPIPPAYMAAIISLESHPPGNRHSERFEPWVYDRLKELKETGRAFGTVPRFRVQTISDSEVRQLATSYGLTQIMGYHCLDLGCSPDDLQSDFHLQWAVVYMMRHYGDRAKNKDWGSCFRIHNTGHAKGTTGRRDYVERGLIRMFYYERWRERTEKIVPKAGADTNPERR